MRQKLTQFMMGRYGVDQLSKILTGASVVLLILSMFTRWDILYILAIATLLIGYFRMFSRNVSKRYQENQKFLTWRYKVIAKWNVTKQHWAQRKTYHFYKCPDCRQKVRVPKGKGKISITCPKCKKEFIKNS